MSANTVQAHRVALIACSSDKSPTEDVARNLYRGALFRKSVLFAEQTCDEWAVLSAKYGLVRPDERIHPYDETLNDKTKAERRAWAARTLDRIQVAWPTTPRTFVFLAGARYREWLLEVLSSIPGVSVETPLQGLGIGRQLQWLSVRSD